MKTQTKQYFDACPECGDTDGYVNVGRSHCLFSSCKEESEAEQQRVLDEIEFDQYRVVEPMPWSTPLRERLKRWRRRIRSMFTRSMKGDDEIYGPIPFSQVSRGPVTGCVTVRGVPKGTLPVT